jgi:excisionase family DNA binding protein
MQSPHEGSAGELLSARQVQLMLGIDRSTVYRMAEDGRLSAIKVGRQWRFPADRIRGLLQAGPGLPDQPPAPVAAVITDVDPLDPPIAPEVAAAVVRVAADLLGVMMVVTDMNGHPVTEVTNPCPWFAARLDDPNLLAVCVAEWRDLADQVDLQPQFAVGAHGFECARAFVRSGSSLVGMVLAGGIAPPDAPADDLYVLDGDSRRQVLSALPKVAAVLSQPPTRPGRASDGRSAR